MSRTSILAATTIAALGTSCLMPADAKAFGFHGFGGGGFSRAAASFHSMGSFGRTSFGRSSFGTRTGGASALTTKPQTTGLMAAAKTQPTKAAQATSDVHRGTSATATGQWRASSGPVATKGSTTLGGNAGPAPGAGRSPASTGQVATNNPGSTSLGGNAPAAGPGRWPIWNGQVMTNNPGSTSLGGNAGPAPVPSRPTITGQVATNNPSSTSLGGNAPATGPGRWPIWNGQVMTNNPGWTSPGGNAVGTGPRPFSTGIIVMQNPLHKPGIGVRGPFDPKPVVTFDKACAVPNNVSDLANQMYNVTLHTIEEDASRQYSNWAGVLLPALKAVERAKTPNELERAMGSLKALADEIVQDYRRSGAADDSNNPLGLPSDGYTPDQPAGVTAEGAMAASLIRRWLNKLITTVFGCVPEKTRLELAAMEAERPLLEKKLVDQCQAYGLSTELLVGLLNKNKACSLANVEAQAAQRGDQDVLNFWQSVPQDIFQNSLVI